MGVLILKSGDVIEPLLFSFTRHLHDNYDDFIFVSVCKYLKETLKLMKDSKIPQGLLEIQKVA